MSDPLARLHLKPSQLRLILHIAESGRLQIAANACAMTQPAASRMLAETERQLGAPLFLRAPSGMAPTEIGTAVIRRARTILREMGNMAADVTALRGGHAGSVVVGAVTGPAVSHLVPAIREIKREIPEADISIEVLPSRDLLHHLTAGEMDFALARILPEFDSRAFEILPMRDEKVAFCTRAGHPLARAPMVTLTELVDHEWIMQQRGAPIREATLEAFASVGLPEPRNVVSSASIVFTMAYLAESDAVASVSEEVGLLLRRAPVGAGFTLLAVQREIRVAPYFLLNLRYRPLSRLAQRVRAKVIEKTGLSG